MPLVDGRGRGPNSLPVPLFVGNVLVERFLAQTVGVGLEAITAAPVVIRIEHHREPVVAKDLLALAADAGGDLARIAIEEARADVQRLGVVHHVDQRALARRRVLGRLDLVQVVELLIGEPRSAVFGRVDGLHCLVEFVP